MDAHTAPSRCLNCNAPLYGPYCAQCGQHAHHSARSLGALFEDAWHLITHMEGRFWGTLRPLLFRPGFLTLEYFAEHRAQYMPPFRLYFVISLLFFGLSSFSGDRPNDSPVNVNPDDKADLAKARQAVGSAPVTISSGNENAGATDHRGETPEQRRERLTASCDRTTGPAWLLPTIRSTCKRFVADNGKSTIREFRELAPKMMFVFLPFMALVMLPLYHHPRRYYVEHLVFYLHVHAAIFLVMLVDMLYNRAAGLLAPLQTLRSYLGLAVFAYILWYVYAAMRRYYGQSRARTFTKYAVIGCAYFIFMVIALSITGVLSAVLA